MSQRFGLENEAVMPAVSKCGLSHHIRTESGKGEGYYGTGAEVTHSHSKGEGSSGQGGDLVGKEVLSLASIPAVIDSLVLALARG